MFPDVGMVQMYSKSAKVNDLVFVWTGWPPALHGLALLLVPTVFPPGGLPCLSKTHCTIPTSALVFGGTFVCRDGSGCLYAVLQTKCSAITE